MLMLWCSELYILIKQLTGEKHNSFEIAMRIYNNEPLEFQLHLQIWSRLARQ